MDMQKETIFSEVETANSKQLAVLKANFPQCFDKNGAFIQEKLLEIVKSSDVELSKESYSLNWLGKSYARLLANLPPKTLLTEDKDHNQREENKHSQNLLIKGDNLEVLKHMVNAYSEKVKMIYIDPPYNTGSDGFVYNDDRNFTPEELSELAGIDIEEATRILKFTIKGSSTHSAWLTFMYPRLYVARELLKEDGVIFISIDDNESCQLKILCDEIFGEQNFIADICVVNNLKGRNDKANIATANERLLSYKKTEAFEEYGLEPQDSKLKEYKFDDGEGKYRLIELRKRGGADTRKERPNMYYAFYANPDNGEVSLNSGNGFTVEIFPVKSNGVDGRWRWGYSTAETRVKQLVARRVKGGGEKYNVYEKDYLESNGEIKRIKPKSVMFGSNYSTDNATKQYRQLMQDIDFSNPKPVQFLMDLILYSCPPKGNHICLDFFAGSGSTAHAVLELNSIDDGNRRFITIQRDEKTSEGSQAREVGINSIFDITKERISRVASINKDSGLLKDCLGFKIYETNNDFRTKDISELTLSNHTFFDDVVLTTEQYDTLLTTWCLYDGSLLTTPIKNVDLDIYKAHLCDGRLYLIAPNFTSEALKSLLQKLDSDKDFAPNKIVFYGSNFESAKQMELNEALKSYANKKSIDLDLVVRN